jgi:phosphoribosylaminoimidazole-succinocarboxamide synthase
VTTLVITQTSNSERVPTKKGKVRDIYDLGEKLLLVATDRLSAFDVVLPDGIPNKGKVLTQISAFWFNKLSHIVPNHFLSTSLDAMPESFRSSPEVFAGRSMLVRKTKPLPVECVVRGYLSGSGWNDYRTNQSICGIKLPPGLLESAQLPAPIFTPSTKEAVGIHDENITFDEVISLVGRDRAERLKAISLRIYTEGAAYAAGKGIIIADTKFEFGLDETDELVWIDEALTPDSSRFWPADQYVAGGPQPSFDKQFVRDYLLSIKWNKTPPGPRLPEKIVTATSKKYEDALKRLTGFGVR